MIRLEQKRNLSCPRFFYCCSNFKIISSFIFAHRPRLSLKRDTEFYRVEASRSRDACCSTPTREKRSFRSERSFSVIFRDRSAGGRGRNGAAERKEYKIKSGVARERAKSDGEGIREGKGDRSLSLSRGSSERTGIGDRSERRLLGSGQWLAATANFSSPCGRMTVTFFRSKAGRILSSEPSAPFCFSSSQATDSRTSLLHGTKPFPLSFSLFLSSALPFVFTWTIFFLFVMKDIFNSVIV